ncbi:MAG: hypothetical protein Q9194_002380 [Teloschistes cf. exilis]
MGSDRAKPTAIGNLITLVRYAYTEANDPGKNKGSLRDLVNNTIAKNYKHMQGDQLEEFITSTLGSDRQFVLDLTAMQSRELEKWKGLEAQSDVSPSRKRRRYAG